MDDSKSEKVLKRVEVVVAVKQRMALSQTESSNNAVDRLANRVPLCAESTEVPRGGDSQRLTPAVEHLEIRQYPQDVAECQVFTDSLQNFAKNKVCQSEALLRQLSTEPIGVGVYGSRKVIDPDGGIHNNHGQNLTLIAT
jgi:hypothetical protein